MWHIELNIFYFFFSILIMNDESLKIDYLKTEINASK